MTETKITNTMILEEIKTLCADHAHIVEFCDKQIASIAAKAEKAKVRAAEKRAAGDELRDVVEQILANATEPMTREMILASIDDPDGELTPAKVGNRASELVKFGKAHKVNVKTEEGKTRVAYVYGADAE